MRLECTDEDIKIALGSGPLAVGLRGIGEVHKLARDWRELNAQVRRLRDSVATQFKVSQERFEAIGRLNGTVDRLEAELAAAKAPPANAPGAQSPTTAAIKAAEMVYNRLRLDRQRAIDSGDYAPAVAIRDILDFARMKANGIGPQGNSPAGTGDTKDDTAVLTITDDPPPPNPKKPYFFVICDPQFGNYMIDVKGVADDTFYATFRNRELKDVRAAAEHYAGWKWPEWVEACRKVGLCRVCEKPLVTMYGANVSGDYAHNHCLDGRAPE
ncbi:MAG: hypothetical protein U0990_09705 [Candidatus Nanopelagicales bacterium]|nr:hypothetical protein [Candidatus Nanopelagicales bacterium]